MDRVLYALFFFVVVVSASETTTTTVGYDDVRPAMSNLKGYLAALVASGSLSETCAKRPLAHIEMAIQCDLIFGGNKTDGVVKARYGDLAIERLMAMQLCAVVVPCVVQVEMRHDVTHLCDASKVLSEANHSLSAIGLQDCAARFRQSGTYAEFWSECIKRQQESCVNPTTSVLREAVSGLSQLMKTEIKTLGFDMANNFSSIATNFSTIAVNLTNLSDGIGKAATVSAALRLDLDGVKSNMNLVMTGLVMLASSWLLNDFAIVRVVRSYLKLAVFVTTATGWLIQSGRVYELCAMAVLAMAAICGRVYYCRKYGLTVFGGDGVAKETTNATLTLDTVLAGMIESKPFLMLLESRATDVARRIVAAAPGGGAR